MTLSRTVETERKKQVSYKLCVSNVVLLSYCFNRVPSISIRKAQSSLMLTKNKLIIKLMKTTVKVENSQEKCKDKRRNSTMCDSTNFSCAVTREA